MFTLPASLQDKLKSQSKVPNRSSTSSSGETNQRPIRVCVDLGHKRTMNTADAKLESTDTEPQKLQRCAECGWPGTGCMPAGVRVTNRNGKQIVIGQLSYFHVAAELCSVCQDMMSAASSRQWFVEAHAEYLRQVRVKRQLLAGR